MMGWGRGYGFGGFGLGHMGGGGVLGSAGALLGLLFLLGLVVLLAFATVWVVRRFQTTPVGISGHRSGNLDLLRHRLAVGEVSIDEYERIRKELQE